LILKISSIVALLALVLTLSVLTGCPSSGPIIALYDVTATKTAINPGDTVDFGIVSAFTTATRSFSVENKGGSDLTLTGSGAKVVITGASNYSIPTQPPQNVPAGGSVTFDIIFNNNTASGSTKNASIGIASNDGSLANLSFNVTGIDQVS
jgi:hypothetical protein